MKSLQQLALDFGTHEHSIESWLNNLKINENEIEFALNNFNKYQRRTIMIQKLRPMPYLVEHPELIDHVQRIGADKIKNLPEPVYITHLQQLKESDRISDKINNRSFPYNDYDAEIFCTLRHVTKKTDITFIKKMFGRSISHHSYPEAKRKLSKLALLYSQ